MNNSRIYRPTYVETDLSGIRKNFTKIRQKTGVKVMPVVKANAYGHGAKQVVRALIEEGAEIFGVATIEEGIELRQYYPEISILILGSVFPFENYDCVAENNLIPVVASRVSAQNFEKSARKYDKKIPFHLKVDTGMGRIGVKPESALDLWSDLKSSEYLIGEGICTHLACADEDPHFTRTQLIKFNRVINSIEDKPPYIHAANSAGIINFNKTHFTLVRPGLAIYGLYPDNVDRKDFPLNSVLSWKSKVIFIKEVAKGTQISYCGTWKAPRKSVIGTIPVGYADGYQRRLSNIAQVLIKGKRCPVIGRVCMDMIMVDLTDLKNIRTGEDVTLIGQGGEERITAEEMAEWADTINYEITTGISSRVPRIFKHEQAQIETDY
ncbi:MAG: alanine racemase [Elusimicrobiota bacterium]